MGASLPGASGSRAFSETAKRSDEGVSAVKVPEMEKVVVKEIKKEGDSKEVQEKPYYITSPIFYVNAGELSRGGLGERGD